MDIKRYDEKTRTLIETCMEQRRTRSAKAITSLEALKKTAEKQKDNALTGFACFHLANTHYRLNLNYHNFRSYLVKAINCLQKTNEHALLARCYNSVGLDASNNGCFDVAYHYYMMAQRLMEPYDEPYIQSIVALNLGQLYARLDNLNLARQSARNAIRLSETKPEDLYYTHNLIGYYALDGIFSMQLGDTRSAAKDLETLKTLCASVSEDEPLGADVLVHVLQAELALVEHDHPLFEESANAILRFLETSDAAFDFIEDIAQFSLFLIRQNELPPVRKLLDLIGDNAQRSASIQMIYYVLEAEIAYCEATDDGEKLNAVLHRRHEIDQRRQSEQNRIYFLSINLIDSMLEHLKELSPEVKKEEPAIPSSKEYRDELTGLPNRLAISHYLPVALQNACRKKTSLGVAVLHVEHLPDYNDAYGKKAGNILMQRLGLELRVIAYQYQMQCMRHDGIAFLMVFEDRTNEDVLNIIEALTSRTETLVGGEADGLHLAVSIGVCNKVPEAEVNLVDYMMEAHLALSEAKKQLGDRAHAVVLRA